MNFLETIVANPWASVVLVIVIVVYVIAKPLRSMIRRSSISILLQYARDLTADARAKKLNPVVGREEEIERLIQILSRKTKNNPLLLGATGVGKTAIVEGFAQRIAAGEVPDHLKNKRVLALDLGELISGTKYRGEFEDRVKKLLNEIIREKGKVILFIDEIHMLAQAKGAEGALNISDILKPALARGDLHAIGATTQDDYEKYIRPDDALERRLQPVVVREPKSTDALAILKGIKKVYEEYHQVKFSEDALNAAVELSAKYIKGRHLPDKAIDLIDEAGAKARIEEDHEAKHAAGVLYAAACQHGRILHEHQGARPVVRGEHIREIVSEWVGIPIEELMKMGEGGKSVEQIHHDGPTV